jgi:hypothetical protein
MHNGIMCCLTCLEAKTPQLTYLSITTGTDRRAVVPTFFAASSAADRAFVCAAPQAEMNCITDCYFIIVKTNI